MVRALYLLAALASATAVSAADAVVRCDLQNHCPADKPCCSQYGECGVGAYCLGGCDPQSSFQIDSCVPAPTCKSKTYTWKGTSEAGVPPKGVTPKTKYLGDSSKTDWVMDGTAVAYQDSLLLTMAPGTVGTVLATSTYMWYGNVKARLKTSRGRGVVTAFILLSDVKDEIDYEYVGVDLETAQTNYYFQGVTRYDQGRNISLSDTFNNYHDYEIRWTPDTITWLVDGQEGRVKKRSDTWNATANQWYYPQTPSRVQISIWPGGLETNAKGTIDWAGGVIDWNGEDIQTNGYYYAQFESVTVQCYDGKGPGGIGSNSGKSYHYNAWAGTNDTVVDGDKPTVLKSLLGTGTNMSADYPKGTQEEGFKPVVPGLTGAGPGTDGRRPDDEDDEENESKGGSGGGAGGGGSGGNVPQDEQIPPGAVVTNFVQGLPQGQGQGGSGAGILTVGVTVFAAALGMGVFALV